MKKFLNAILYLIITLLICNSIQAEKAVNYVIWLRDVHELTSGDRQLHFNLVSFRTEWEVDAFSIRNIIDIDPYFILAKKVKGSTEEFMKYKNYVNPSEFEEQYSQYFISTELKSVNGYFYILTDQNFCKINTPGGQDDEDKNLQRCVTQFYITFYRNYKYARKEYEKLFLNDKKDILFGGASGLIDSPDPEFFFNRYTQNWCNYHFGLWQLDFLTQSKKLFNKWYVFNWKSDASKNDAFALPLSPSDKVTATTICNFDDFTSTNGYLAVPSEFESNCNIKMNTFDGSDYYRLYCASNVVAAIDNEDVVFPQYRFSDFCKDDVTGKTFLVIEDLNVDSTEKNNNLEYDCACKNTNSWSETFTFSKTFNSIWTQSSHTQTESPTIPKCDYSKTCTTGTGEEMMQFTCVDTNKKAACANSMIMTCTCSAVKETTPQTKDLFIPKWTVAQNLNASDGEFEYSNAATIIMQLPLFNPNSLTDH
jgi:hypothetical protein